MFDTGSAIMDLDSTFVSKYGFSKLKTIKRLVQGAGVQGFKHIDVIKDTICYQIGNHKFYAKYTAILNVKNLAGHGIDGVIGMDFVKKSVIKIDFQNQRFFIDSVNHLELKNSMPFRYKNNQILLPVETVLENGKIIYGDFLIDFGDQGAVTFLNEFAQINNFDKIIANKIKYVNINAGYGGKSTGYDFRANYVKIGNVKFIKPVLDYSLDSSGLLSHSKSIIGVVGLALLSRTNITFDFDQQLMYIEPNSKITDKFRFNKGYGHSNIDNNKSFKVTSISENSAAEKCGLRIGDTIIEINDKRIDSLTNVAIDKLFDSHIKIHLIILKNGKKFDMYFTPKEEI
jgi:hypothetical protein